MLRVATLRSRTGAYYLRDLAAELGPVRSVAPASPATAPALRRRGTALGVTAGRWTGAGAGHLGLEGPVDPGGLEAVLSGAHPGTGRSLSGRSTVVGGYDLTFAAAKSVSVLFGLGRPDVAAAAVDAHERAVEAAMGYVARRAAAVRRTSGDDRRLVPVDGVIAASFTHGLSRSLDPHLHTHVVVANVAHGEDSRWSALDARGLFAHAPAAGALYDAHLRHLLSRRLGVGWTHGTGTGYEVDSVDPAVLGELSGRRAEIRRELAAWVGGGSPRSAPGGNAAPWRGRQVSRRATTVAWMATREPKPHAVTADQLRRTWQRHAASVGLEGPALELARPATAGTGRRDGRVQPIDEHRFAAALYRTPHATAARRDVVAAWAGALAQGAQASDVERCAEILADWGEGVGVHERRHTLSALLPPRHLARALGPRPGSAEALGVWRSAAETIDRYRARWGVSGDERALGLAGTPHELSRLPARRLADHLAVRRGVEDARRRLGRDRDRAADVPQWSLDR